MQYTWEYDEGSKRVNVRLMESDVVVDSISLSPEDVVERGGVESVSVELAARIELKCEEDAARAAAVAEALSEIGESPSEPIEISSESVAAKKEEMQNVTIDEKPDKAIEN